MLTQITYFSIFGKPLIMYGGILTLLLFLIAATIPALNKKGITTIPFQWHSRVAKLAIASALIHGSLGILAYF